ncbi:HEAT repeat-containing protein 1 [Rhizoctonia solani]|uniref:HEAT repeat-containing protein 1 n=1 Tax=Rhizoctonia solani TaxID=456999 RepID=A0A0K6GA44_9AGAM|nr:HEAT repeat-containing protein 1 [Rhizoctonia solani]
MTSSGSHFSSLSVTSSSQAVSDGFPSYTRKQVRFYDLVGLEGCERCDMDQFLAVFLERCRAIDPPIDPSTPRIQQSAGSSQNPCPSSSHTKTESGHGSEAKNETASAPDTENIIDPAPVSGELFNSCLQKMVEICNHPDSIKIIRDDIQTYQQSHKEKRRYIPFVRLGNHIFELLKRLKIPGLREASSLDILFHTNAGRPIQGMKGVREPDVVIVSLAGAKRARSGFEGDWNQCAETECPRGSRKAFEWADILITGEMKWHYSTLDFHQPATYGIALKHPIEPLPTRDNDASFPIESSLSASKDDGTITTTSTTTSISSAPASFGLTHEYPPAMASTGNSGASTSQLPCGTLSNNTSEASVNPNGKRYAEDFDEDDSKNEPSKRAKVSTNHETKDNILDAVEKSGINGAEMLRCSLGRNHSFGMIVIGEKLSGPLDETHTKFESDATVWIWWFDRQGAIQSTGFNFIEDLPRFMVFLLAIQRFDITDWGFNEKLDPTVSLRHSSSTTPAAKPVQLEFDGTDQKFTIDFNFPFSANTLLHEVFSLRGNSTNVFKVTSNLKNNRSGLVAKLYWPNQDRLHEADIIKRAREDTELVDYLPCHFGSRDIDPIGTRRIRQELGIAETSPRPPRLLRMMIFDELLPITELTGDKLIFAWLQCIRCHYRTWKNHVPHLDLSLGNLMLRARDGKYFGVVNDWDLGNIKETSAESRKDLTKTILFTSLDLLRARPPGELIVQRYVHDLESFAWILVWIFLTVQQGGHLPVSNEVNAWKTGNATISRKERGDFIEASWQPHFTPHEEWRPYSTLADSIAAWLNLNSRLARPNPSAPPKDDLEVLREFLQVVESEYTGEKPTLPRIEDL